MADKIKILQMTSDLDFGGAETMIVDIVENIDKDKFEVVVCCINKKGSLGEDLAKKGYKLYEARKEIKKQSYYSLAKRIKEIIKLENPDIVHSHCDSALIDIGPIYTLNRSLPPLIHTFHFGNYPHIAKKYIYLQMLFTKFVTQLVAVGTNQKQRIVETMKLNPDRIHTLLNGVSNNEFIDDQENIKRIKSELNIASDELVIGCVAVLTDQKGIDDFIKACGLLRENHPKTKWVVVGSGPLLDDLKSLADELDLNDFIIFAGWRSDVKNILPIFDIYVIPSLWEAMSISLLEAMAAKRAIVATDVGENSKVIAHNQSGLIVQPGNLDEIVSSIQALLEDEEKRSAFADNAYDDYINKYSVQCMVDNYSDLYGKVYDQQ
ncbi:MAG: glycosyltransferase family 4 protein [Candidatus Thiodiazotropha sp.]